MATAGQFGPWVVERPIGRGGMATVYRCHHIHHPDRIAALKVLHDPALHDRHSVGMQRFAREVRLLRRLDHPGIVGVLDAGVAPSPWIALALVPGKPLHQRYPDAMPADAVLDLGGQLADALVHAHQLGVFHRDVKPSNILVDPEGRAWLVDFGIAMAVDETPITDSNRLAPGTLAYAPPEWFRPLPDRAPGPGDAYGLGVVLWEGIRGEPAFGAEGGLVEVFRLKSDLPCLDPGEEVGDLLRGVIRGLTQSDLAARLPLTTALDRLSRARGSRLLVPEAAPVAPRLLEPQDTFVGRGREIEEIRRRLARGDRLLTLLGPGGAGKSRLALRALASLSTAGAPDGIVGCDLTGAVDLDGMHRLLGRALGVPLVAGDTSDQLVRVLQGRGRILLLLDNVEPLLDAVRASVSGWLVAADGLTVVATSRTRLRIAGERVLEIPPLDLPAPGASLAEVAEAEAVALLVARIRESDPEFAVTEANAEALTTAVAALDGLPLAIEIAAARRRTDPSAPASDPLGPETGALKATLDASWRSLDPAMRRVLAQCSVFEGSFSLEAAEAVLDPPRGDHTLLDVLQDLVDRSLLQVRRRQGGFAMLRTIRSYAREHLPDHGGSTPSRLRHAEWFAGLSERFPHRSLPPTLAEIDNARAACAWAVDAGEVGLALRTGLLAGDAAQLSGPLLPEAARLAQVLALPGGDPRDRIRVRLRRAWLLERGLDGEGAMAEVERALREVAAVDDPSTRGVALSGAARVGWDQRPPQATLDLIDQSVAILEAVEEHRKLAQALILRANVRWCLRLSQDLAERDLDQAEAALGRSPDPFLLATALAVRATITGASLVPVIDLARRRGYIAMLVDAECMAGLAAADQGDLAGGEALLRRAADGARRCGFVGREADSKAGLAAIALRRGDLDAAEALCRSILDLRGETEADAHPVLCNQLGLIAMGRGDRPAGAALFDQVDGRGSGSQVPVAVRVEELSFRALVLDRLDRPNLRPDAVAALAEAERLAASAAYDARSASAAVLEQARRQLWG